MKISNEQISVEVNDTYNLNNLDNTLNVAEKREFSIRQGIYVQALQFNGKLCEAVHTIFSYNF